METELGTEMKLCTVHVLLSCVSYSFEMLEIDEHKVVGLFQLHILIVREHNL